MNDKNEPWRLKLEMVETMVFGIGSGGLGALTYIVYDAGAIGTTLERIVWFTAGPAVVCGVGFIAGLIRNVLAWRRLRRQRT